MKRLQQLLFQYPIDQFFAKYWTQKALHIATDYPQRFQAFFSWIDLTDLLNYHKFLASDLHFSLDGKSLPDTRSRQDWISYIQRGATLIINGIHQRVSTIVELAADLRQEFGYETHINLYCSPTKQQGFECHYDTHEVLILQLEGEKAWFIYDATIPYPTQTMSSVDQPKPQTLPYLQCLLKPGDLLYIPRGHWHYAIAADQPSLHLTIGIECQKGLDWLDWLIRDLQNDPIWRQSLSVSVNGDRTQIEHQLTVLKQNLIKTLQRPDLINHYLDDLTHINQPPILINLPSQLGTNIFDDLTGTQFIWSPLHQVHVKQVSEAHYTLNVGSKQIDLKGVSAKLVDNFCSCDRFTLLDLAEWVPELELELDVIPLITRLVKEGVLHAKT
jgi:ribosomal protein L16 Arg81 hydroxylase